MVICRFATYVDFFDISRHKSWYEEEIWGKYFGYQYFCSFVWDQKSFFQRFFIFFFSFFSIEIELHLIQGSVNLFEDLLSKDSSL